MGLDRPSPRTVLLLCVFASLWLLSPQIASPTAHATLPSVPSASHEPVRSAQPLPSSAVPTTLARARRVVLSCFFKAANFYRSGRVVPSWDWVAVFLLSLHEFRDDPHAPGRLTRAVLWLDAESAASLRAHVHVGRLLLRDPDFLTLIVISNETHAELLAERWASKISNGANNFRFALYRDWLIQNAQNVDEVMISDVTDVAFQRNPWRSCMPRQARDRRKAVVFTYESEKLTFAKEKYNRRWMSCFGDAVVNSLAKRRARVSCAGVTFGGIDGMIAYTSRQVELIARPDLVDCAVVRIGAALDQATHNYMLHNDAANFSGRPVTSVVARPQPVLEARFAAYFSAMEGAEACTWHGSFGKLTLGETHEGSREVVVGAGARSFAVVHQYTSNRHPRLMAVLQTRYLV